MNRGIGETLIGMVMIPLLMGIAIIYYLEAGFRKFKL